MKVKNNKMKTENIESILRGFGRVMKEFPCFAKEVKYNMKGGNKNEKK